MNAAERPRCNVLPNTPDPDHPDPTLMQASEDSVPIRHPAVRALWAASFPGRTEVLWEELYAALAGVLPGPALTRTEWDMFRKVGPQQSTYHSSTAPCLPPPPPTTENSVYFALHPQPHLSVCRTSTEYSGSMLRSWTKPSPQTLRWRHGCAS